MLARRLSRGRTFAFPRKARGAERPGRARRASGLPIGWPERWRRAGFDGWGGNNWRPSSLKRTKAAAPSAMRLSQASCELIEGSGPRTGSGAVSTTAARYKRRDKQFDTHQYRRYLPRGNGCDVLQCTYRPEPEWLWFKWLCWITRGIGLERWVWRKRARRRCRAVSSYSDLLRISTSQ
jgi:hypothetical protein